MKRFFNCNRIGKAKNSYWTIIIIKILVGASLTSQKFFTKLLENGVNVA